VSTKDFREAMCNGVVLNFDDGDGRGNITRRVPLRADHIVYWSGTWHRGLDDEGRHFLRAAGKMLYMRRSVDLEAQGLLAKVAISIIVCKDDEWTKPFANDNPPLRGMSIEKCRVLEWIITLHLFYGHKIMVFSRYIAQVDALSKLFPGVFTVKGNTQGRESLKDKFKSEMGAVWVTTTIGDRGLDVPDVQVIINLANYGESPGKLFQRMGRGLRDFHKFAWFYDLVSPLDQHWPGSDRSSILCAPRYSILNHDGYQDRIKVISSSQIQGLVVKELRLEHEQMPSIAYDDPSVQANHLLSFYRAVSCKDKGTFDHSAATAGAKTKAAKKAPVQRKRSAISKHYQNPARVKQCLAAFRLTTSTQSTSSALSTHVREPEHDNPSLPTFMTTRKHLTALQAILAASPHSVVGTEVDALQPATLWKLVCDVQVEAETVMKRVDEERSTIRKQICSSLEAGSDDEDGEEEEIALQDRCTFIFKMDQHEGQEMQK